MLFRLGCSTQLQLFRNGSWERGSWERSSRRYDKDSIGALFRLCCSTQLQLFRNGSLERSRRYERGSIGAHVNWGPSKARIRCKTSSRTFYWGRLSAGDVDELVLI